MPALPPMSRTPSVAEFLSRAVENRLANLHTAMPARVEKYDAAKGTVDALPLLRDVVEEDENGEPTYGSFPVITAVPVVFPGAGGFRVTFPVQPGDIVLLVFSERAMGDWLMSKGDKEVDSPDMRTFDLNDAIAIPGLRTIQGAWKRTSANGMTLGADAPGGPLIEITSTQIQLGGTDDAVALASKVLAELNRLKTVLSTWEPTGTTTDGTALKALLTPFFNGVPGVSAPWPSSVASPLVKTKA